MKTKCQIIPATVYDNLPPIVFEDDIHRYILGSKGNLIRLRKKTCSLCASSMSYVCIFEFRRHQRVERFCTEHASYFGTLPIPQEQECKLTNKEKLAIQKWTNIKVSI